MHSESSQPQPQPQPQPEQPEELTSSNLTRREMKRLTRGNPEQRKKWEMGTLKWQTEMKTTFAVENARKEASMNAKALFHFSYILLLLTQLCFQLENATAKLKNVQYQLLKTIAEKQATLAEEKTKMAFAEVRLFCKLFIYFL